MNITHAKHEEINGDRLKAIFDRQKELMAKYHDIELRSGLMQTEDCPVNLDDKRGQARIKDFSWRIIEEVGEALDALESLEKEHFKEELVDGLHFLTELTILSGFEFNYEGDGVSHFAKYRTYDKLQDLVTRLVKELGMMCNCLKNKPWKQTNMVTDKNNFYLQLELVWYVYFSILLIPMEEDEIVDIYLRKSQVNKFRQRSNY